MPKDAVVSHQSEMTSFVGMAFILTGTVILSTASVTVKMLEDDGVPFIQLTCMRYSVVVLISGALIIRGKCRGEDIRFFGHRGDRTFLFLRAACYYGALNFYYWSLVYLPLGLVTVITYSFPIVIGITSHWGLMGEPERLTGIGWLCNIGAAVGLCLAVSSENESGSNVQGILLAIVATICWSLQVMIIRRTRSTAHWLEIEFITGFVSAILLTPGVLFMQYLVTSTTHVSSDTEITLIEISTTRWVETIALGTVAFASLSCITIGFQLEEAPRGAILMYLEIPLMYVAQWVLFGEAVSTSELIGVLLMLSGIVGASVEKIMISSKVESVSYKSRFSAHQSLTVV